MIHFITAHFYWKSGSVAVRLLTAQNKFIKQNAPKSTVWACTNGGTEEIERATELFGEEHVFDYDPQKSPTGERRFSNHALKYDYLVSKVRKVADPEDIIVFLDSDAWPVVGDFEDRIKSILKEHKFAFIKDQAEDFPHASFFACTLKSWDEIEGTWGWGRVDIHRAANKDDSMRTSEMGASLAFLVDSPDSYILKVTASPFDPSFYCTWGDDLSGLVYHHGAGSRQRNTFMPTENKLEVWSKDPKHFHKFNIAPKLGKTKDPNFKTKKHNYFRMFTKLRNKVLTEIETRGMEAWGLK